MTTERVEHALTDGCVFCGETPLTVEHVFSTTWLQSVFLPTPDFTTRLLKQDTVTGKTKTREWKEKASKKGKRFGPQVKCVCKGCNEGWMKAMDEAIAPVLTPLARGENGTISSKAVEMLATWATKVALVLDSADGTPVIDPSVKHRFRNDPTPLEDAVTWIGAASPVDDRVRIRTSTLNPTPHTHDPQGKVATFGAIHVLFQVFIPTTSVRVRHRAEVARLMHPFWPHGRRMKLSWPPPAKSWLASERDFQNVADLFELVPPEET
jgi:hypothetical protein